MIEHEEIYVCVYICYVSLDRIIIIIIIIKINQNKLTPGVLGHSRNPSLGEESQAGARNIRELIQGKIPLDFSSNLNEKEKIKHKKKDIRRLGDGGDSSSGSSGYYSKNFKAKLN